MHRLMPDDVVLRVCAKITSGFGGSAAWPDARREEGASPFWGCDRRATPQPARRRPAPEGWGDFAFWLRFSSVAEPWLCSFVVPRQKAKSPPAKPEFIFAQTLKEEDRPGSCFRLFRIQVRTSLQSLPSVEQESPERALAGQVKQQSRRRNQRLGFKHPHNIMPFSKYGHANRGDENGHIVARQGQRRRDQADSASRANENNRDQRPENESEKPQPGGR